MGQQVQQECFFTCRRVLDQLDQLSGLLGIEGQRGNAQCSTLGYMVTVGFQHGSLSIGFLRVGAAFSNV